MCLVPHFLIPRRVLRVSYCETGELSKEKVETAQKTGTSKPIKMSRVDRWSSGGTRFLLQPHNFTPDDNHVPPLPEELSLFCHRH